VLDRGDLHAVAGNRGAEGGRRDVAHVGFDLDGLGKIGTLEPDSAIGASGMQRKGNSFTGMQPYAGDGHGLTQRFLILHT
jgi:hypothetical protein